ncbi:GNAT family N-acetyltransferase [Pseudoponticoccus marisrubri]|uniref:N-acetyltransferase domain-containing protein n=1 Tax=Pseudoponticoccus marisrubri TaxID=1685382 RepID=A0A0W7WNI0_9RHOB|nr:GNAT family N-acetyltransferase [Pseudoponticoccus marisrubri]KUF12081.1 hypothetical protein AVJ23_05785 [Pseudoponticoccus marisrubri]
MSDALTLRPAETGDIAALDRLFLRSYSRLLVADYPPSVMVTVVPKLARAQPELLRSGRFYVVEEDGRLLGAGGWSLAAPGGGPARPGIGHVRHVATDPDSLRRGVGRQLIGHIKRMARAVGVQEMHCQSTRTAVPFYRAAGFAPRGDITVPLPGGIGFDAVLMVARLEGT